MKKLFLLAILLTTISGLFAQAAEQGDTVKMPGCDAYFYFYPAGPECNKFSFYSVYSVPGTHSWDFGDGFFSTQQNPEHIFPEYGEFEVCLTINDPNVSCTVTECKMVEVVPKATNTITGYVYYDQNADGIKDIGEAGIPNHLVHIGDQSSAFAVTDKNGIYSYQVDSGLFDITTNAPSGWTFTTEDTVTVNLPGCNEYATADFGLRASPGLKDLLVVITPLTPSRPGLDVYFDVDFANLGSDTADGIIMLQHDPGLAFSSADPSPNSYNGGTKTLEWIFTDLPPGGSGKYRAVFNASVVLSSGEVLQTNVKIGPSSGDASPANNQDTAFHIVTNSFAYNVKEVHPEGDGPLGLINITDQLTYTIHFQNIGTDTAFNMRVVDTLDEGLSFSSVRMLASSHPNPVMLTGKDWEITWVYNNIRLPDSSDNLPESYGYIKFAVFPDPDLTPGTQIRNKSYLYFDFNPPEITNNTLNTINGPAGIGIIENPGTNVIAFPNPATDQVMFRFENPEHQAHQFTLYDAMGNEIVVQPDIRVSSFGLNAKALQPGIYFFRLTGGGRLTGSGKIIIHNIDH